MSGKAQLRRKDREWLSRIGSQSCAGMYPGMRCCDVPDPPAHRLRKMGFIVSFFPHNQAHKDRWVITDAGRVALAKDG